MLPNIQKYGYAFLFQKDVQVAEMDHVIKISAFLNCKHNCVPALPFTTYIQPAPTEDNFFAFFFFFPKLKSYAIDFFTNLSGTGSDPDRHLAPT